MSASARRKFGKFIDLSATEGGPVTGYISWEDVKAKARAADPAWDSEERIMLRRQIRAQMVASVNDARRPEGRELLAEV